MRTDKMRACFKENYKARQWCAMYSEKNGKKGSTVMTIYLDKTNNLEMTPAQQPPHFILPPDNSPQKVTYRQMRPTLPIAIYMA